VRLLESVPHVVEIQLRRHLNINYEVHSFDSHLPHRALRVFRSSGRVSGSAAEACHDQDETQPAEDQESH